MRTIPIPAINQKFSDTFSRDAANAAKKIRAAYGSIISAACASVGVNVSIAIGFMIVENTAVDPTAMSGAQAIGLMQLQTPTAFQTIKDQAPDLTSTEASIIQKYLPGFLKPGGFVGFEMNWKDQIHAALMKPEFNIWIGVMLLGQLINKNIKDFGEAKLDHLIVKYNRGVGNYNKEVVKAGLKNADTATLVSKLPVAETRSYIVKFLGIDGSLLAALRTA